MAKSVFNLVGRISMEGLGGVAKGLNDAEKNAVKFSKQINKVGRDVGKAGSAITKSISGPLAVMGGVIAGLSYKTGQYADKLLDLSEATDLSTDTLQELRHVSTDAGVSFDSVTQSIQKFSRRLSQAGEESGRVSEVLSDLGIKVRDDVTGEFRSMNDMFPEIIKSLQGMENRTKRNTMAQQIFGSELKNLAPIMGMTNEKFEKLRENAHSSGRVMSEDALKAANDFRIAVDNLKEQFGAAGREIATKFIPVLQDTVLPLIQDQLIPMFTSVADKIKSVADWFAKLPKPVQETTIKIGAFLAVLGPGLLVISKLTLAIGGIVPAFIAAKKAVVSFSVFMSANPFGAALVALGLLAAAALKAKSAFDQLNESRRLDEISEAHNKEMRALNARRVELEKNIESQEALQKMGGSLFSPRVLAQEKAKLEEVRLQIVNLHRSSQGLPPLTELLAPEEAGKGVKKLTSSVKELTDEQIAAIQRLKEERDRIDEEYMRKLDAMIFDELELLEMREMESIAEAQRTGASVQQIRDYYALRRQEIEEKSAAESRALAEQLNADRESFEKMWSDNLLMQSGDRLAILEREYDKAIEMAQQHGADVTDIEKYYSNLRKEIADSEAEHTGKTLIDKVQEWGHVASRVISDVGRLFSSFNRNRIDEIDQQLQKDLEANELSRLSEEEKLAKSEELNEEADAKKRELNVKQAKREKATSIFQIAVNTAGAIMKAFQQLGPIAGAVAAAVVGGIGIAQTALVASQPLPSLDVGGVLQQDRVIQAHANEAILPLNDAVMSDLGNKIANASGGGGLTNNKETHYHFNIGTLVSDGKGEKEFVRRVMPIIERENQRAGRS